MLGLQYTTKALNHWKKRLPNMVKEMREDGTLNEQAQKASMEASRQVAELMAKGYQQHEAEEIVLPELILLPPEKKKRP
jgi:hypothetical protein